MTYHGPLFLSHSLSSPWVGSILVFLRFIPITCPRCRRMSLFVPGALVCRTCLQGPREVRRGLPELEEAGLVAPALKEWAREALGRPQEPPEPIPGTIDAMEKSNPPNPPYDVTHPQTHPQYDLASFKVMLDRAEIRYETVQENVIEVAGTMWVFHLNGSLRRVEKKGPTETKPREKEPPRKVETTGVVFQGFCSIHDEGCIAFFEAGALTAVWLYAPGRIQGDVCEHCLHGRIRSGVWVWGS